MSINLNNLAILNIPHIDCRCIINRKSEAVGILQNSNLTEKIGVSTKEIKTILSYITWVKKL